MFKKFALVLLLLFLTFPAYAGLKATSTTSTALTPFNVQGSYPDIQINGINALSFPYDNVTGGSIAIGSSSLINQTVQTGSPTYANTAIGYQAIGNGTLTTAAIQNTAIGYQAGASLTSGTGNVFIGYQASASTTAGTQSVIIGSGATTQGNLAGTSVVIGYQAASGNSSVAIGWEAGHLLSGGVANNITIGYTSGSKLTSGTANTILGSGVASTTLASGSSNILIGTSSAVDTVAASTSNNLNIGNLIQGDMTNSTAVFNKTLFVQSTTSEVDYVSVTGSATGTPGSATISALGADTNIGLILTPKATGTIQFNGNVQSTGGGTPTCGTGCSSVTAGSTNTRGSMVSGSSVSAVTLNFSTTLPNTPFCVISDSNTSAVSDISSISTSAMTVSLASALSAVTIYWQCMQ